MLHRNLSTLLDSSASGVRGERIALEFGSEQLSFHALRERSDRLAGGLFARGVRPGDRVAVLMNNGLEWPITLFALARLGAVCVPVNVLNAPAEVRHVCTDSDSSVLVHDDAALDVVGQLDVVFDLVVATGEAVLTGTVGFAEVAAGDAVAVGAAAELNDTFILYYSSGTTGLPKAAEHTHGGILWNAASQIAGLGLSEDDRYLVVPSFSWAAGFHNLVLGLLALGGRSIIRATGGASVESIVADIERHDITRIMLVPSLLRQLATRPDLLERLDASTLQWIVTGAEPVPRAVLDECNRRLPRVSVCQGYGQSEFPTMATVLRPYEVDDHEGSAGRPMPFVEVAVLTDDGVVSEGTGELLTRSLATMRGYAGAAGRDIDPFHEGWLRTGDLASIDRGFVTIVGRTKDLIISGGLNVYPKEIEDVIYDVDGVREVAVVGIDDDRFGEAVVAVVVHEGADAPADDLAGRVAERCRERLAGYKQPRRVLVRPEPLPRSATSKLLKREIRPWVQEHLDVTSGDPR